MMSGMPSTSKPAPTGSATAPAATPATVPAAAASAPTPASRGIAVADVVGSLGGGLLRIGVAVEGPEVDDLTLAEPAAGVVGQAGDLLLGVGIDSSEAAADLLARAAAVGSGAVVLRRSTARRREVRAAARRSGVTLVELADHASWAHVVWLLRGVLDRAATGTTGRDDGPVHDELFSLADACAALVEAPVTIEDTQSRVLAHSARQDVADPIRVSTIVGRRVPDAVLSSLRSRGVFRRLARSDEPVYVPADGDLKARLVIPVRAGEEWLGSIWVVVEARPEPAVVRSLSQTASVVALHLLGLRSQTDLARRVAADRLRAALTGEAGGADAWLPPPPWRVVVLDGGPGATAAGNGPGAVGGGQAQRPAQRPALGAGRRDGVDTRVDLWESVARRRSWRQPLLTVHDGLVHALVHAGDDSTPGSWAWLQGVVAEVAEQELGAGPASASSTNATVSATVSASASAGTVVGRAEDLDRSRREAGEVHRLRATGQVADAAAAFEDVWAAVTVARAVAALPTDQLVGPALVLVAHDEAHRTAYAHTVAAWLDHPGDPRAAAEALHVHPNTLRYRLQRLSEVVELDLHDAQTRLALRLQLRALGH